MGIADGRMKDPSKNDVPASGSSGSYSGSLQVNEFSREGNQSSGDHQSPGDNQSPGDGLSCEEVERRCREKEGCEVTQSCAPQTFYVDLICCGIGAGLILLCCWL